MSKGTSRALPFCMFVLTYHVARSIPNRQTNKLLLYTIFVHLEGVFFFLTVFNLRNLPNFSTFINDSFTSATSSWMHLFCCQK